MQPLAVYEADLTNVQSKLQHDHTVDGLWFLVKEHKVTEKQRRPSWLPCGHVRYKRRDTRTTYNILVLFIWTLPSSDVRKNS